MLKLHYPERLDAFWFLNAPTIFWALWRVVGPMVRFEMFFSTQDLFGFFLIAKKMKTHSLSLFSLSTKTKQPKGQPGHPRQDQVPPRPRGRLCPRRGRSAAPFAPGPGRRGRRPAGRRSGGVDGQRGVASREASDRRRAGGGGRALEVQERAQEQQRRRRPQARRAGFNFEREEAAAAPQAPPPSRALSPSPPSPPRASCARRRQAQAKALLSCRDAERRRGSRG